MTTCVASMEREQNHLQISIQEEHERTDLVWYQIVFLALTNYTPRP